MPQIGDRAYSKELGYKSENTYIWASCKICKKERWVQEVSGKPRWEYCRVCAQTYNRHSPSGSSHYNWKGGITRQGDGYMLQLVESDSPYWSMVKTRSKQVLQHRLVMAEYLRRPLKDNEIVHHLNGIRDDNRIENLALSTLKTHEGNTLNAILQERIRELERRLGFIDK